MEASASPDPRPNNRQFLHGSGNKLDKICFFRQAYCDYAAVAHSIKISTCSLPELEAIVQSELEHNPMLEPLDIKVPLSRIRIRDVRS